MKIFIGLIVVCFSLFATTYIGVGYGESKEDAKQSALKNISEQISVNIQSNTTRSQELVGEKYTTNLSIKQSQSTNTSFSDYEIIESSYKSGEYFVKIRYENIPSLDKFANKIKYTKKQILDSIKKDFGSSLNLELIRKDKRWYIKYKDIMQVLDKKDFTRYFKTTLNDSISIKTNKKNNILYENDEFYFKIKSKQSGYVSIVTVYENGTVSVLMKNIKIRADIFENIPDKDFEAIPQAGLLKKGKDTFDMYVVIFSQNKLIFDNFANADDELISNERYKNLDELIYFLQNKTYSTLKVVTKAR